MVELMLCVAGFQFLVFNYTDTCQKLQLRQDKLNKSIYNEMLFN